MGQYLDNSNLEDFKYPTIIDNLADHPIYKCNPNSEVGDYIIPQWKTEQNSFVIVSISCSYSIYGLLMIGDMGSDVDEKDPNIKFLNITAHQLAMSLENLELLEETQKAYSRLKELQDETIQLEKMATRGEMSAEIGHELNNFLGVVAGNLSLLDFQLKKKNYTEIEKYVFAMTDNIEKIKKFTANLMDLRPISSKKEVIYFDRLITEVIDYLKPQKRFRDVKIELQPIRSELPFEADIVHIQQLLYNIFNNAADATEGQEKKEIVVSAVLLEESGNFRVDIKDTGIGIEQEYLEKAFKEKFTTKKKGHGFGLLVCKRIIDSHNGILNIDSKPGEGTLISIDFPLKKQPQEEPAAV